MGLDLLALRGAKNYVDETLEGAGALKGEKGDPGTNGVDGVDGKSAYEIACDNGFEGSEEQWLESLKIVTSTIADAEVRLDKTYSSSKIHADIQSMLNESKTYTLEQIAKTRGASYKVVETIDDMIDTRYIYLLSNGDTYDLYIFDEDISTPIRIGETTIDLTQYLTIEEAGKTYVLQTSFDNLNNSIGNVSNLLTTAKTIVAAINEVNEKSHDHSHQAVLDKLSESKDGNLLYGGKEIAITADSEMSDTSTNPVQNAVVKKYIDDKEITVSNESDNAIEKKDDGIYVKDNSETIGELKNKVDTINQFQKYVNTEMEYLYAECGITVVSHTGSGDISSNPIYFVPTSIAGNMTFNNEENYVLLKAGKTYQGVLLARFASTTSTSSTTVGYGLIDKDTKTTLSGRGMKYMFAASLKEHASDMENAFIITPDKDIKVAPGIIALTGSINQLEFKLTIQEVGHKLVVDPLEHANSSHGIEDAPVGHVISYMGLTAPAHYLICDGAEYNIADYPYLSQHFIDEFGSVDYFGGDGETTFAVPDLRGEFLRGSGTATRNSGSGAAVGVHQEATQHNRFLYTATQLQNYHDTGLADNNGATTVIYQDKNIPAKGAITVRTVNLTGGNTSSKSAKYTSRPTNTAVLYCIKYEPTYFMQNTYNGNEEVVLYEGITKVQCGNTTINYDIDITLIDSIENYDEIIIYYAIYNASVDISYFANRSFRVSDILDYNAVTETLTGIWGSIHIIGVSCLFKDAYTLNIFRSIGFSSVGSTINNGINIYKIVGRRTSLVTE